MTRFRLWIAMAVVLAAGAGLAGGVAVEHYRCGPGKPREPHILHELNLTDEQRAKILPIWEDAMRNGPKPPSPELIDQAQNELDAKLNALLTDEQRVKYDQYKLEYRTQLESLRKSLDEVFGPAEQKTRALLTPEQQKKFDEIRERMRKGPPMRGFRDGPRGPGGPPDGPGGPGGPGGPDRGRERQGPGPDYNRHD